MANYSDSASSTLLPRNARPLVLLAALLAAAACAGCEYSSRERFFDGRSALVPHGAGTGTARVARWPSDVTDRTAVASARGGRVSDTPLAPASSEE